MSSSPSTALFAAIPLLPPDPPPVPPATSDLDPTVAGSSGDCPPFSARGSRPPSSTRSLHPPSSMCGSRPSSASRSRSTSKAPSSSVGPSWAKILWGSDAPSAKVNYQSTLCGIQSVSSDFVHFSPEQLRSWSEPWEACLIGKFFGKVPPLFVVSSWAKRSWNVAGFDSVLDLEEGFFVFQFRDLVSSNEILFGGPYFLRGEALRLVPWRPCFRPWCENFSSAPVWVRFLSLPLEFWNIESINKLSLALGKVIFVDQRSFEFSCGRYVRVCIELDLSRPLRNGLWVGEPDKEFFRPLSYENLSIVCFACGLIELCEFDCPKQKRVSSPVGASVDDVFARIPDLNLVGGGPSVAPVSDPASARRGFWSLGVTLIVADVRARVLRFRPLSVGA
ncbi:hypothetical protein Cni_G16520 [Canna indica]|uniref:DUF4283 domain-containing protein n=1 Tax=Canna indica TaxID=4628 RepID=A0AAQ3KL06_9LILI|nr:hypothetical protein Cni_G16520 [Canna indica]